MAKHNYKMGDFVKLVAIGNGCRCGKHVDGGFNLHPKHVKLHSIISTRIEELKSI